MTTESFALKMFEEIGGLRGDLKEVSATMRGIDEKLNHMNNKIEDVKVMAKGAAETAMAANDKANKALDFIADHKEDIDRLYSKFRESAAERKADRQEASNKIFKWISIVVPASIGLTGLVVTVIFNLINN
ncbi:hypothetical protein A8F95_08490 [Bacillus wudalianchiensis]|uniref:Uncharacterized protein n=2 Tax=Pseudobacillus wudalianchiensis TaxID=1743143 RepID=A0A1B9ATQ1_9BACI|nr:hypothetical protein A8F95_08490 [Bacillus wudalianchiensis]